MSVKVREADGSLKEIAGGVFSPRYDIELSSTSKNAVQNRTITKSLKEKQNIMQFSIMPDPAEYKGQAVIFTGISNDYYTTGMVYYSDGNQWGKNGLTMAEVINWYDRQKDTEDKTNDAKIVKQYFNEADFPSPSQNKDRAIYYNEYFYVSDGTRWNKIEHKPEVDNELSETSENPVQNKIVQAEFNRVYNTINGISGADYVPWTLVPREYYNIEGVDAAKTIGRPDVYFSIKDDIIRFYFKFRLSAIKAHTGIPFEPALKFVFLDSFSELIPNYANHVVILNNGATHAMVSSSNSTVNKQVNWCIFAAGGTAGYENTKRCAPVIWFDTESTSTLYLSNCIVETLFVSNSDYYRLKFNMG